MTRITPAGDCLLMPHGEADLNSNPLVFKRGKLLTSLFTHEAWGGAGQLPPPTFTAPKLPKLSTFEVCFGANGWQWQRLQISWVVLRADFDDVLAYLDIGVTRYSKCFETIMDQS